MTIQQVLVALFLCAQLERKGIRAARGFTQGVGAHPFTRHFAQVFFFLRVSSPAQQGVGHQCVLHIAEHRNGPIDASQFFHCETGHGEGGSGTTPFFGGLDAHQAHFKKFLQNLGVQFGLFIHLGNMGFDFSLGELADGLLKSGFFVTQQS